ncbi:hypothetical protein L313_2023 [Acinetobacter haemolyticus CIP 64.3 = MTCC 9819]|nr:hypothetical protein L313_2023 [Acinetobacter haemolyticus CIP 64.3 = MTCC 9819]
MLKHSLLLPNGLVKNVLQITKRINQNNVWLIYLILLGK